jgi:hypothetical protein
MLTRERAAALEERDAIVAELAKDAHIKGFLALRAEVERLRSALEDIADGGCEYLDEYTRTPSKSCPCGRCVAVRTLKSKE